MFSFFFAPPSFLILNSYFLLPLLSPLRASLSHFSSQRLSFFPALLPFLQRATNFNVGCVFYCADHVRVRAKTTEREYGRTNDTRTRRWRPGRRPTESTRATA